MQPPSLKWTPIALMYISHYTWPKVISTKQDKSKEPEEPGVPRCARSVPVVPWCAHMCRGCTRGVPGRKCAKRGSEGAAPPRPAHQALSPKIHTTWKTQNNRQQQQGQNNQNTHTTSSQKNKRTIISKQAYRQKEFMRRYCMGGEGDPQTEIDT